MKPKLKRTNFFFPLPMLDRLQVASEKSGISKSELLRRALENLLAAMGV
jgi:predicted DNA-binding protein